jgi:hypothetical protein
MRGVSLGDRKSKLSAGPRAIVSVHGAVADPSAKEDSVTRWGREGKGCSVLRGKPGVSGGNDGGARVRKSVQVGPVRIRAMRLLARRRFPHTPPLERRPCWPERPGQSQPPTPRPLALAPRLELARRESRTQSPLGASD